MKLPKRFEGVPAAAKGLHYLVIGWMCWGRGADLGTAVANCKKASCGEWKPGSSKALVYEIEADGYIDGNNMIVGNKQRKLAEVT